MEELLAKVKSGQYYKKDQYKIIDSGLIPDGIGLWENDFLYIIQDERALVPVEDRQTILEYIYRQDGIVTLGRDSLYEKVKEVSLGISRRFAHDWLKNQVEHQTHRRPDDLVHAPSNAPSIYMRPCYRWAIDLIDLNSIKDYQPGGGDHKQRYVLTCIDMHSRYLWGRAMRDKTKKTTVRWLLDIFRQELDAGRQTAKQIQADNGGEFQHLATELMLYEESRSVESVIYTEAYNAHQNGMIERANGTLKRMLWQYFTANPIYNENGKLMAKTKEYTTGVLQKVIDAYNNRVHSSTKFKPIDLQNDDGGMFKQSAYNNIQKAARRNFDHIPRSEQKLEVGMTVQIAKENFDGAQYQIDGVLLPLQRLKGKGEVEYWLRSNGMKRLPDSFARSELVLDVFEVGDFVLIQNRLLDVKFRRDQAKAFGKSNKPYWSEEMYQITDKVLPGHESETGNALMEKEYYHVCHIDQETLQQTRPLMHTTTKNGMDKTVKRVYRTDMIQLNDNNVADRQKRAQTRYQSDQTGQVKLLETDLPADVVEARSNAREQEELVEEAAAVKEAIPEPKAMPFNALDNTVVHISYALSNAVHKWNLVPSDGNCLYAAMAYTVREDEQYEFQTDNIDNMQMEMRTVLSEYFKNHIDLFDKDLWAVGESGEQLTIEDVCEKILLDRQYGGELELTIFQLRFKYEIVLIYGKFSDHYLEFAPSTRTEVRPLMVNQSNTRLTAVFLYDQGSGIDQGDAHYALPKEHQLPQFLLKTASETTSTASDLPDLQPPLRSQRQRKPSARLAEALQDNAPVRTRKNFNTKKKQLVRLSDGSRGFIVDAIDAHRIDHGRMLFHTYWLGYRIEEATWEPKENLIINGIPCDALQAYLDTHPNLHL